MSEYADVGMDRAPGLLDDLSSVIDRLELQVTQLEDRLKPVVIETIEREMTSSPEPAPENRLHGQIMALKRVNRRLETQLQNLRL